MKAVTRVTQHLACLLLFLTWSTPTLAADRPNILWLTCEDLSSVIGCYGDELATTPAIDDLAERGVRYTHAFASASVCSPARSCLITGIHATTLGTQHLRSRVRMPASVRCYGEYLREAGYYCTNNGKEDYQFVTPKSAWDVSSGTAHWKNRPEGKPFFAVFNLFCTHQSQVRLPAEEHARKTARLAPEQRHDPAEMVLPPYYPDTPEVRRIQAQLYDQVTLMDMQVADKLAELEETGVADDTIVFFYADHGTGLPRHKRWLYDSGIRVPMVIYFPEKYRHLAPVEPGRACDRLVSFVDFAPTVLSLAGVSIPDVMQGIPFLGPATGEPREYLFAVRDRVDEVIEMRRAVRDRRYLYIRNYLPHRPEMQRSWFSEKTPIRQELRRLAAADKLDEKTGVLMASTKPPEALYDTEADPDCMNNLLASPEADPEHHVVHQRLRDALRDWTLRTRDTGFLPEAEMYARAGESTVYDMAGDAERYPIERILAAAELVGASAEQLDAMVKNLEDPDPAVRYWGAVAISALDHATFAQADSDELVRDALSQVTSTDPSPNVRLAAAETLCRWKLPVALDALSRGLEDPSGWVRLHAVVTMQQADCPVAGLADYAKQHAKSPGDPEMFIRWCIEHIGG